MQSEIMWNDSTCDVVVWEGVGFMNDNVVASGFLGIKIGAAMLNVATYVDEINGWDDWDRFDEVGWMSDVNC